MRGQRRKLHLSLDELAKRTHLSKGFLSQVERGETHPSIESLSQIADALRVPLFLFFVEESGEKVVMRQSELRKLGTPDSRFQFETIWFGARRKMEIIIGRLQPGESSSDQARVHQVRDFTTVEECFYVLQGAIEFELGEERHVLQAGDSGYFSGSVPHRFTALGSEEAVLLFAISPPAISR